MYTYPIGIINEYIQFYGRSKYFYCDDIYAYKIRISIDLCFSPLDVDKINEYVHQTCCTPTLFRVHDNRFNDLLDIND